MKLRNTGYTQTIAAAKTGISERTGRRIETGECNANQSPRKWRTRKDPLDPIWENTLVPMLETNPALLPSTLLDWLNDNYPNTYPTTIRRTLQRRFKQWKAIHGVAKEVMFRQQKRPGQLGLSDFTQLKRVQITIKSKAFTHLLYHYRLAYSGWCYVKIILGGESFAALSSGLQDALWKSSGVPKEHRSDSLSAAFNNSGGKEQLTKNYNQLCKHYGVTASRNNPGKSHENGAIESPHGHFKRKLEQALLLRGTTDFASIDDYQKFIDLIIRKINKACQARFTEEQQYLSPLPQRRTNDYLEHYVRVTSGSTINIRRTTYSVPSRLIGEKLRVHLYDDHLKIYSGHIYLLTLKRVYTAKNKNGRLIDYKHVIHSLIRKPEAFRYSQIRDDLLPSADYKQIWLHADNTLPAKEASRYIVQLLFLASKHNCEASLGRYVLDSFLQTQLLPNIDQCQKRYIVPVQKIPEVISPQHLLSSYNQFLTARMA